MKKALFYVPLLFLAVGVLTISTPGPADAKKKPPPPEPPTAVQDQLQLNTNGTSSDVVMTERPAQTFVPSADGELTQVGILMSFTPGNSTTAPSLGLTVEIQETMLALAPVDAPFPQTTVEALVPSGVVLASVFLPKDTFTPDAVQWYSASFSTPPMLTGGVTYAIVLHDGAAIPPATEESDFYYWFLDSSAVTDPYAAGEALYSSGMWGFDWSVSSVYKDQAFDTYMIFDAPPPAGEICNDGIDNDGDNKIDCDDRKDCNRDPACP